MRNEWKNFKVGVWCKKINVSDFIKKNYTPYNGDESFLEKTTSKTNAVWKKCIAVIPSVKFGCTGFTTGEDFLYNITVILRPEQSSGLMGVQL